MNDIGFVRRLAERDCKVLSLAGFLCVQIREARNQTLGDCLKKEFRITVNIMRSTISIDAFEVKNHTFLVLLCQEYSMYAFMSDCVITRRV